MEEFKKQWLPRILAGALAGMALHALLGVVLSWWNSGQGFQFLDCGFSSRGWQPEWMGALLSFALWALFWAEVGVATLPFADSGRELVVRSLVHYAVTAATMCLWLLLTHSSYGFLEIAAFFLVPLTLVYLLIWLGRWVGWFAEVAAIREKLGLAPGPSLFHWKESLPYVGFAFLLCLVLPTVLRLLDDPTPLLSVFYAFVLLPVGGVMSGLSLGRRHGFCPLYPVACGAFIVVFILTAKLYTNMADGAMIPIAFVAALAGNLAGAAQYKLKQRKGAGAT